MAKTIRIRIKIIIVALLTIINVNSARAAEFSILPWPDKSANFVDAINIVKENSPNRYMLSVWGWERLEPKKGNTKALTKELEGSKYAIHIGLNQGQYYGVTVIDTVKRVLPSDIMDIKWDDPILLERYTNIVERLRNELQTPPDYFVIANESDVYFEKHPDEIAAFLKFATAARKVVKQIFPTTPVGFTATFEGLSKTGVREDFAKQLVEISDIAFFTYYPVIDMIPTPPRDTPAQLDVMIKIAKSKPIALQEIGYPSGIKGSSEEQQAKFFEIIIPAIQKRPQIKFVSIFALHDFDDKTCKNLTGYYGFGGLISLLPQIKDFQKFLCTLGLRHADGSPKAAWKTSMDAFAKITNK